MSGTLGNNIGANSSVTGIFDTQANNVTTTGALFGSGNLTKIGSGILTLNGSASNTGTLFINAGIVNLGSTNALSTSVGTISFGGGTLQYSGANTADYSAVIKSSTAAITIDTSGQNVTFGTALANTNTGGLTKNGDGTLTLSVANSYSGPTTVNGGILKVAPGLGIGPATGGNLLIVNSAGTVDINNTNGYWLYGGIAGTGKIISSTAANVILALGGNSWNQTFGGTIGSSGNYLSLDFRSNSSTWNLSGVSYLSGPGFGWGSTPANASTINLSGTMYTTNGTIGNQGSVNFNILPGAYYYGNGSTTLGLGSAVGPGEDVAENVNVVITGGTLAGFTNIGSFVSGTTGNISLVVNSGGAISTSSIYESHTQDPRTPFNLTINGGTIYPTASGNIFADNGGVNELGVQIGANGAFINTGGFTVASQRPLMNVTGSSTAGSLTVTGGGSLDLTGSGNFTGTTLVNGGTVKISSDQNLGVAPSTPVANQVELNGGTLNFSSALSGVTMTTVSTGTYASIATATVTSATGAYVKVNNSIVGITGGIGTNTNNNGGTLASDGVTVLIGAPDMPGGIQATASALLSGSDTITGYTITNPGSGYSSAPFIAVYKTSLGYAGGDNATVSGLSAAGFQYTLSGSSPVVFDEGIVTATPTVSFSNGNSGTVTTTSSLALAANRGIQLDGSGGTLDVSNSPAGFTATVNGPITGTAGGGLTKTSGGTLVLTASSNYNGPTAVNGGTMIVSGSIYGTPAVSVASGATLEVDGNLNVSATTTVNGTLRGNGTMDPIIANAGSTIAPGLTVANAGTGTLTATGPITLSGSTTNFAIRLGLTTGAPGDNDQLAISSGAIALNGANLQLTLGGFMNNPANIGNVYEIIAGGYVAGTSGTFKQGGSITLSGYTFNILYGYNAAGTDTGNAGDVNVDLQLTAIPEPGTWAAMLSGFGMLLCIQRIRRKSR